ncbi:MULTISPECIES: MFS transporter [unclassified Bacillus (in: firmicutes)]|uniref:MFS transporter n=1 Tax=unclassified Bacillus (in: firmicutes) TaxID=185979 RepID=UPI00232F2300|nr:MFS transporter [Bacillus sp. BP-3]MDC2866717.1 MFS transporter [Bacillus sp. BP-3]
MESKQRFGRLITVVATFLAFSGIGVVDPILPIIAEKIGATHWQVEMLFTAYILTMAIMMLPAGLLAARFGDKRMMTIGLAIVTVFACICGLSQTIAQLSIFRAGWGLGNAMFFATAMTLLIALSKEVHEAVGLYEAAIGLGMAGGPLLGGLLGGYSWRYPFFATSVLIALAFILVFFFVKEPERKVKRQSAGLKELINLVKYKPFIQGAISGMLYYYAFFVVLAYSPLILHLSAIQLGFVFCGWGLALAYGSAKLAHRLEEKYEPKMLLRYSLLVFAGFLILLFFVHVMWLQIVLIVLSGLASGLNNALFTSYVMDISPYERSITSGVYNFVRWLGGAIAPILSGILGHVISPQSPFLVGGIVALVGCVMICIPVRENVKNDSKTLS